MITNTITFFSRFATDILSGRKTITIRDASECDYQSGNIVVAASHEAGTAFCQIEILSVTRIAFAALSVQHAKQENMSLPQLKQVITEIYPGEQQLYVIAFKRVI